MKHRGGMGDVSVAACLATYGLLESYKTDRLFVNLANIYRSTIMC